MPLSGGMQGHTLTKLHTVADVKRKTLTRVIQQRLVLAFLGGGDQIPDEALDLVITFVVSQAVNQESPAGQTGSVWRQDSDDDDDDDLSGHCRIPAAFLTCRSPPCLSL